MKNPIFSWTGFFGLFSLALLFFFQVESADFTRAMQIWLGAAMLSFFLPAKSRWLVLLSSTLVGLIFIRPNSWWPILGSIFSLRLVLFLLDVRKNKSFGSLKEVLSYFFMLPNFALLLFPLVSYDAFAKALSSEPKPEVRKKGAHFILVGLLQIFLWKILRYHYYFPFAQVHTWGDLFKYLPLNFLLYLRISGAFHLIVGTLQLFGIDLPRVNNFYLFSTGFIDFWRRINIYFRDFVIKLLFHPAYFLFKRWGHRRAFLAAILFVLVGSWALHGLIYLSTIGSFRSSQGESVFWLLWGAGIFINSYWDDKYKSKKLIKPNDSLSNFFQLFCKITFFSAALTLLWSISTAEDVLQHIFSFKYLEWNGVADFLWILIFPLVGLLGAVYRNYFEARQEVVIRVGSYVAAAALALLALSSQPELKILSESSDRFSSLGEEASFHLQNRDYYSGLQTQRIAPDPDNEGRTLLGRELLIDADDFRDKKWNKNVDTVFLNHRLRTSSQGLADVDHTERKPEGVVRFAVLASCVAMSWGIEFGSEWPRQAEKIVNTEPNKKVEFVNFSVPSYGLPIYPYVAEKEAAKYSPDFLVVEITAGSVSQSGHILVRALKKNQTIPYDELLTILGVNSIDRGLAAHFPEELSPRRAQQAATFSLKKLDEVAKKIGARVILAIMPDQLREPGVKHVSVQSELRTEFGKYDFQIIDLSKEFDGKDVSKLIMADDNMSEAGHALVGAAFAREFTRLQMK